MNETAPSGLSFNVYRAICDEDIYCLLVALLVSLSFILFTFAALFFIFNRFKSQICPQFFPIHPTPSLLELNEFSQILMNQENSRISAHFKSRNADIHIQSDITPATL